MAPPDPQKRRGRLGKGTPKSKLTSSKARRQYQTATDRQPQSNRRLTILRGGRGEYFVLFGNDDTPLCVVGPFYDADDAHDSAREAAHRYRAELIGMDGVSHDFRQGGAEFLRATPTEGGGRKDQIYHGRAPPSRLVRSIQN